MLADSAYSATINIVPIIKRGKNHPPTKDEKTFNYYRAKARVNMNTAPVSCKGAIKVCVSYVYLLRISPMTPNAFVKTRSLLNKRDIEEKSQILKKICYFMPLAKNLL